MHNISLLFSVIKVNVRLIRGTLLSYGNIRLIAVAKSIDGKTILKGVRMRTLLMLAVLPFLLAGTATAEEPFCEQFGLFVSGEDDYHTYRIPAMVVTNHGIVLAFCEGRKEGQHDHGNIHLMLKRSFDNGKSWTPMQLVWKEETGAEKVTWGNPCPLVDHETGVAWLACCRNNDRVFVFSSEDDGESWSEPREITVSVKDDGWGWYATGPGNGIQATTGRLIVPCDHCIGFPERSKPYYSHVFYSDDHGRTWRLGGTVGNWNNECAVVELMNGALLLNMRTWDDHRHPRRRLEQ